MSSKQAFDIKEYYSRLKREIKELCKTPESSELINELGEKIKAVQSNYR